LKRNLLTVASSQKVHREGRPTAGLLSGKMRNINCCHYSTCLREAALRKLRDLPCQSCQFKDDNSYRMSRQDVHGLVKLLVRAWGSDFNLHDSSPTESLKGHRVEDFY
jgi:hypothetical protein